MEIRVYLKHKSEYCVRYVRTTQSGFNKNNAWKSENNFY